MAVFFLKQRDTRPILEVVLRNPDGTVHDLTGSTAWKLHIRVNGSIVVTRDMVKQGADTAGTLRYTWAETDWGASLLPATLDVYEKQQCPMEYEVIGGSSRLTFPNDGHDVLEIRGDLA